MLNKLRIYTDGACSGNPGAGAWAYLVFYRDTIIYSDSGFHSDTTNNRMELVAFLKVLENFNNCEIILDSKYVLDGVTTWLPNWKRNQWKSSTGLVKNQDLWKEIDQLYNNREISLYWQKGHANSLHDYVDLLARECCKYNIDI